MADGSTLQASKVRQGARVLCSPTGETAEVLAVVAYSNPGPMVGLGALAVTATHPKIRVGKGQWLHPLECVAFSWADTKPRPSCNTVFQFVLDRSHAVIVEGKPCASYGRNSEAARKTLRESLPEQFAQGVVRLTMNNRSKL
jgi:hypothetical protein